MKKFRKLSRAEYGQGHQTWALVLAVGLINVPNIPGRIHFPNVPEHVGLTLKI
jgi:hypothetical protein